MKVLDLENALQVSNIAQEIMKGQLKTVEEKVERLQKKENNHDKEAFESQNDKVDKSETVKCFECKKCTLIFENKSEWKKHVKEKHQKKIECDVCAIRFDSNIDLEEHLKTHENPKCFQCDICEKEFYLKLRLRKHKEGHEKNLRYCHFFNNSEVCPYEENGCMFLHSVSPECKFNVNCDNKLCLDTV
jgi:hypothetical protein